MQQNKVATPPNEAMRLAFEKAKIGAKKEAKTTDDRASVVKAS